MDYYDIWFNLKDSHKDTEFCAALEAYMAYMVAEGKIEGYRLRRRRLGFGPAALGEFNITIETHGLAQLDEAFNRAAPQSAEAEALGRAVYAQVKDMVTGLSRDFPDPAEDLAQSDEEDAASAPGKKKRAASAKGRPEGMPPRRKKRKRWQGAP